MSDDKLREAAEVLVACLTVHRSTDREVWVTGSAIARDAIRGLRAALADSAPEQAKRADVHEEIDLMKVLVKSLKEREAADAPPEPTEEMVDQRTKSDCLLACIASLTGLPVSEMPQPPTSYENLTSDGEPTDEDREAEVQYGNAVRRYLRECGWLLLNTYSFAPAGHSIASGPSPRNPRIWHCVIYRNGELTHDPHSSRAGVVSVEQYEVLVPAALAVQQKGEGR